MRREVFEKMISKLYPDQDIQVVSYQLLEKNQLNENGEWISDVPAVFVEIKCDNFDSKGLLLSDYFTNFTGYEFAISKV